METTQLRTNSSGDARNIRLKEGLCSLPDCVIQAGVINPPAGGASN